MPGGVQYFNTYGRPHSITELVDFSAAGTARHLNNGSNNLSLKQQGDLTNPSRGSANVALESSWTGGTTGVPGVGYRWLVLGAQNCQVNISSPTTGMSSILYNPSTNNISSSSRLYITSSEYSNGFRLYCKALSYSSFSYMTVSANNFSYGFSTGFWVWYNSAGSFQTSESSSSTSLTLYIGTRSGSNYHTLLHSAI